MYRKTDLQFLRDIFDRKTNDIALLYGLRSSGLSELVSDLIKDKECLYYRVSEVSDSAQKVLFAGELHEQTKSPIVPNDDYEKLIDSFINDGNDRKRIIVFDDFQYLIKENPTFINFLAHLMFEKCVPGSAMYLLVSDDIHWIELDMIRIIGKKSSEITGVLKLNEYSPTEFYECFPDMPLSELIGIYSFIGGKSLFYNDINAKTTLHELVIAQLNKCENIFFDPNMCLPRDIREPMLYNTLLVYLAQGHGKLNDLHLLTEVDRAKLSVYLKALIENDIVEKAGTAFYRIKDRTVNFYYRFIFPHLSSLRVMGAQRFYRKYIESAVLSFVEGTYHFFCMEHIKWLENHGRLGFKVTSVDEYHDKNNVIDFVIVAAGSNVIACSCLYSDSPMEYLRYENVKSSVKKNKLNCENIWLFSTGGFDDKIKALASKDPGLKIFEGKGQYLH